jgi:hypothetical protein
LKIRYKIWDNHDERSVAENEFPLVIGAGPTADIQITDLKTDEEAAYIGISRKRPFVQVGPSDTAVQYNHRKLDDSTWLMHGDIIDIAACRIYIKVEDNHFIMEVIRRESESESARPPSPVPADQALKIEPLAFRPERRRRPTDALIRYRRFIGIALGLSFLLLIIAAWFVFTARQIIIQVEPRPDQISIGGA